MIRMTAITPSARAVRFGRFAVAAQQGMQDAAEAARLDFEKTTATWQHEVEFSVKPYGNGYQVGTSDEIYGYVDRGTRAHKIVARRAKRLRFGSSFTPKTRPGSISSGAGGSGGAPVFRQSVNHPGSRARNFSKLIGAKWRAQLGRYVQQRIREAA